MPITQSRLKQTVDIAEHLLHLYKNMIKQIRGGLTERHNGAMGADIFELLMNDLILRPEIDLAEAEAHIKYERKLYNLTIARNERNKSSMRRARLRANGDEMTDYQKTRLNQRLSSIKPMQAQDDGRDGRKAPIDDDGYVDTYIPPPKSPFGQSPIPSALRAKPGVPIMPDMTDNSPISTYKMSAKDFKRNIELSENGEREIRIMLGQEEDTSGIPQDVNPFTGKRKGEL